MNQTPPLTLLLHAARRGEASARQQLFELAYGELKRIARSSLRRVNGEHSLNPTALVHEAWVKIARGTEGFNDSTHFYSLFARAMRQVLLDLVRGEGTVKRGVAQQRVDMSESRPDTGTSLEELLQIDAALRRLETLDPDLAELVEWHFFAGLSFVDIAAARGVNERTVRRHWEMARALLLESMG